MDRAAVLQRHLAQGWSGGEAKLIGTGDQFPKQPFQGSGEAVESEPLQTGPEGAGRYSDEIKSEEAQDGEKPAILIRDHQADVFKNSNESIIEDENEIGQPLVTGRNYTVLGTRREHSITQYTHRRAEGLRAPETPGYVDDKDSRNYSTMNLSDLPPEEESGALSQQTFMLTHHQIKTGYGVFQQSLLRTPRAESQLNR